MNPPRQQTPLAALQAPGEAREAHEALRDLHALPLVAAIARDGSLAGAARALRLNHATVFRRLEALEARLGARLFERQSGRYSPTPAGDALADAGRGIEQLASEAWRRVAGHDQRASGVVRIATTDSVASELLLPLLPGLREALPEVQVHVSTTNDFHDLGRRDADLALRPAPNPPPHLVGQRIGALPQAVYAARGRVRGFLRDRLPAQPWVALDDSAAHSLGLRWLQREVAPTLVLRCAGLLAVRQACALGLGLAVLPCFLGERDPALARIGEPVAACASELWLLAHPDLRQTARVRAVYRWLGRALVRLAPRLGVD